MRESRNPITCPQCETVNPWMNDTCRSCGADLTHLDTVNPPLDADAGELDSEPSENLVDGSPAAPAPAQSPSAQVEDNAPSQSPGRADRESRINPALSAPKARLNIFWVVLGIAAYIVMVKFTEYAIAKWVIAPDPDLKQIFDAIESGHSEISDSQQEIWRTRLFENKLFLVLVFVLVVGAPFLISAAIGYFTRGLREGAMSISLAVFINCLLMQQIFVGLIVGVVYVGLGLVGAIAGNWFRTKLETAG